MTAKLAIYQHFILRLCDADKRATHPPTRVSARMQRVREAAAIYAANAVEIEAAMQTETEQKERTVWARNIET